MATKHTQAWQIDEAEFKDLHELKEKIVFFVRYAILAPSPWNSQPWKFKVDGNRLELYADPDRKQENRDPECREQLVSCGAALANAVIAAKHFGFKCTVQYCPAGVPEDCVGIIDFAESDSEDPCAPSPEEIELNERLFKAIPERRSYRQDFQDRPISDDISRELQDTAAAFGVEFVPLPSYSTKLALAGLVAEGDWYLEADQATRDEYASWIRSNENKGDGVPGYALGMGKVASMLAPVTHRLFDYTAEHAHKDSKLTSSTALIGVFAVPQDDRANWVLGGAAMQHVLLHATARGIQASFLNQPIPVPELRQRLSDLLGRSDTPISIVRLGHPNEGEIKPTPRLPVEDMLID